MVWKELAIGVSNEVVKQSVLRQCRGEAAGIGQDLGTDERSCSNEANSANQTWNSRAARPFTRCLSRDYVYSVYSSRSEWNTSSEWRAVQISMCRSRDQAATRAWTRRLVTRGQQVQVVMSPAW